MAADPPLLRETMVPAAAAARCCCWSDAAAPAPRRVRPACCAHETPAETRTLLQPEGSDDVGA